METQQAGLVREVCGPGGKDAVVFASRAWLQQPAKVSLPEPPPAVGLLLPGGDINWSCPCLGGMAAGPCGPQFRDAFSCFHYSTAEPKGSECYDKFSVMQACMARYPSLYGRDDDDTPDLTAPPVPPAPPAESTESTPSANH